MTPQPDSTPLHPETPAPEIGFSHELIHTFAALISNLEHAHRLLDRARNGEEVRNLIDDVDELVSLALYHARAQRYDAYNLISQRWPELIGELSRPNIERRCPIDILEDMLPHYSARACARGVEIILQRGAGEPMPPIEVEVFALQRAFHNILSNAIKYSYKGGAGRRRYIRIWFKCVDQIQRAWGIFFQNFGVGILPSEASQIFLPSYRGILARKDRTYGCGLGLSEARKCVEAHGGMLRFKSVQVSDDGSALPSSEPSEQSAHPTVYLTTVWMVLPEQSLIRRRPIGE